MKYRNVNINIAKQYHQNFLIKLATSRGKKDSAKLSIAVKQGKKKAKREKPRSLFEGEETGKARNKQFTSTREKRVTGEKSRRLRR